MREKGYSIESGLRKLPAYDGSVYRGIWIESLDDVRGGKIEQGAVIQTDALSSFTHRQDVSYLREGNSVFRVNQNHSGVAIENAAWRPSEGEVLVPSQTPYRINNVVERASLPQSDPFYQDGGWIIDMDEIT